MERENTLELLEMKKEALEDYIIFKEIFEENLKKLREQESTDDDTALKIKKYEVKLSKTYSYIEETRKDIAGLKAKLGE